MVWCRWGSEVPKEDAEGSGSFRGIVYRSKRLCVRFELFKVLLGSFWYWFRSIDFVLAMLSDLLEYDVCEENEARNNTKETDGSDDLLKI